MRVFLAAVVLIGLTLLVLNYDSDDEHTLTSVEEKDILVRYAVRITNTSNEFVESAEVRVFAPLGETSWQKRVSLDANQQYETKAVSSVGHNETVVFPLNGMPPFGSVDIIITSQLKLFESPTPSSLNGKISFLADGKLLSLSDPLVKSVSQQFSNVSDKDLPQSVFNWIANTFEYSGYEDQYRGLKSALKSKRGDCTEYTYAFFGILRALGYPARGYAGFYLPENVNLLESGDYHNWAEYHTGERWVLVDPQKANFDRKYSRYVAFGYLSEHKPFTRFEVSDKRLKAEML